jgi:hypothetical protein
VEAAFACDKTPMTVAMLRLEIKHTLPVKQESIRVKALNDV